MPSIIPLVHSIQSDYTFEYQSLSYIHVYLHCTQQITVQLL